MPPSYLQPVETEDPPRTAGAGGENGNGGLVGHRLNELERRVGALEGKVDVLATTCARIEARLDEVAAKSHVGQIFGETKQIFGETKAKLDEVATKSHVWKIFGGTTAFLALSIMGHLLIRTLTPG